MNREQFREALKIDAGNLDEEIVRQPTIFERVSRESALARATADTAKEEKDRVESRRKAYLREKFAGEGSRTSEAALNSAVLTDKKFKQAVDDWLDAKREADLWFALEKAWQQRSSMLRDLSTLYVANYFERSSAPKVENAKNRLYDERRKKMADARRKQREKGE